MPGFFCKSPFSSPEQPSSPNDSFSLGAPLIDHIEENSSPEPAIPRGYFIAVSYTDSENDKDIPSDSEVEFEAESTRTSMPGR